MSEPDESALLSALSSPNASRMLEVLIAKGEMSAGELSLQALVVPQDCAENLALLEKARAVVFVKGRWRVTDKGKEIWEKYFA